MTLGKGLLVGGAIAKAAVLASVALGRKHERARAAELVEGLKRDLSETTAGPVDFNALSDLPAPVERYFRSVLTPGQKMIRTAELQQSGQLRTSTRSDRWWPFTATETLAPPVPGFAWNARVDMPLGIHVTVLDSYVAGVGSGRVSLLSAVAVGDEADAPELNSGALHRYLAEAVWCPTALLPQAGVVWSPVDGQTALATLTDRDTTVSLEFGFNEAGEVISIYAPARYGQFGGVYRALPWKGHFRDYRSYAGMRVPSWGEVGWYVNGRLETVWRGHLVSAVYEFDL